MSKHLNLLHQNLNFCHWAYLLKSKFYKVVLFVFKELVFWIICFILLNTSVVGDIALGYYH